MTQNLENATVTEKIQSRYFGSIPRDPSSEIHLPVGLPGFESETCLIAIEIPDQRPLVYLQSTSDPTLCFLALPVNTIAKEFQLQLNDDERAALFLSSVEDLIAGENVLALAILFPFGTTVQANLSAPLMINLRKMVGIQCLPADDAEQRRVQLHPAGDWVALC